LNLVKTALTYVAIFSVGAVTSVSCFEPQFGNPSFRCSPSAAAGGAEVCPEGEACCSDDPSATGGRLPNYFNGKSDEKYGPPIFSSNNNPLSTSGMCVATGGFQSPFANGCPVPCNPTWSDADTAQICGTGSFCCQMQELDPNKDCIVDPETMKWRAVRGSDIGKKYNDGRIVTSWGDLHSTNQDPDGANCKIFSAGSADAFNDCIAQLTVADQRGFCYGSCPCIDDVCDMKNPGWVSSCTPGAATTAPTI
jgi:hypothetical protein